MEVYELTVSELAGEPFLPIVVLWLPVAGVLRAPTVEADKLPAAGRVWATK